MSALETSIVNLTAEYSALTEKLKQIDQQYRVGRPNLVSQIGLLAKALSALTGKPVVGASGQVGRKPMSEAGKAAIRTGLEKARAAKAAAQEAATIAARSAATEPTLRPQGPPVSEIQSDTSQKCIRAAKRESHHGR